MFASCISNLWERMFEFRMYTRLLPKLIWSLQGPQQSLSLGINPIDNAEPCFPRDNIVGDHSCDECKLSNQQKRLSQALVRFVTRASLRQSASILCSSPTVSSSTFVKSRSSRQRVETLYIALSFCSPAHNIFQPISYDHGAVFE